MWASVYDENFSLWFQVTVEYALFINALVYRRNDISDGIHNVIDTYINSLSSFKGEYDNK